MEEPRPLIRNKWGMMLLIIGGIACGYLFMSPYPMEFYRLIHRGLRRHGIDVPLIIRDRRGLGVKDNSAGNLPVTMSTGQGQLLAAFGEPFYRLFATRDQDGDGFLNPEEFRDVYQLLGPVMHPQIEEKKQRTETASPFVTLVTRFEPLRLDTLTKEMSERQGTNLGYMKGLVQWRRPHRKVSKVPVADLLELFWPQEERELKVGDTFDLLLEEKDQTDFQRLFGESTNRYYLPATFRSRPEEIASHLLGAFHPRAFPYTRYHPSGSAAVVRAMNKDFVEIFFRLHLEFQLNEPPLYPFWFTPSYFLGQVIFSRNLSRVVAFHLDIPKERLLNVDMEWVQANPTGNPFSSTVEVDIGHIPKMELSLKNPISDFSQMKWAQQISLSKAFRLVERRLYPFKKIEYASFRDSFIHAKAEQKLVHSVVLWGSLDDQSC